MHRTGLKITVFFLLFMFVFSLVSAPIARAEEPLRPEDLIADSGEPTDPERARLVCLDAGIDLDEHGITLSAADPSWFETLLNFLRSLGLLPGGTGS
jgi:hypothetical protein